MRLFVLAALLGSLATNAQAQTKAAAPPNYARPLGIGLEAVAYPYPVRFLEREIDGQKLRMAYMDVAPASSTSGGTRPPVLLLHGKNFYGSYWSGTIKALHNAGYRVIVPDQIGFGKSSKPDIAYSFDLLAQNTIALLDSLHVTRVSVVGHSMGGMLAVRLARNYPLRVAKLVLENPIGLEDYRSIASPVSIEKLYADELADTDAKKIRAFYKKYFVTWKPEYERFVEVEARLPLSGEWPRFAKASARTYQMIFQQPTVYDLPRLTMPTLLVIGQADRTVVGRPYSTPQKLQGAGDYPRLGKQAAKAIRNAQLVELAKIGHIPHLEAPQPFQTALLKFLHT